MVRVAEPLMQAARAKIRGLAVYSAAEGLPGASGGNGADTSAVELRCQPKDLRTVLQSYPGLASRARAMRRKLARNGKAAGR